MKFVHVIIDRPVGYIDDYGTVYQINYGYVPGVIGGDGEEQDAYILDYDIPLVEFTGKVIAIVERADDIEVKWVVSNKEHSIEEIYNQIYFIEKYFNSKIVLI